MMSSRWFPAQCFALLLTAVACSDPADTPAQCAGDCTAAEREPSVEDPEPEDCRVERCQSAEQLIRGDQVCVLRAGRVACSESGPVIGAALHDMGLESVVDVTGGALHRCALLSGGSVECWGDNQLGALGDPSLGEAVRPEPAPVPGVSGIVAIDSLHAFYQMDTTCGLTGDGRVWCWNMNLPAATELPNLSGAEKVAVGDTWVCASFASGGVRCQPLFGGTAEVDAVELQTLPMSMLDMGWRHVCGVPGPRDLLCASLSVSGDPIAPFVVHFAADIVELSSTMGQTCARLANGDVSCVGAEAFIEPDVGLNGVRFLTESASNLCGVMSNGDVICAHQAPFP